ncbi:Mu transposase C-terminal domain-containing protein [Bilophila wadsworthia]|uniref:Mu transposase C-terminal domain-containing protein n=1 Tax=Bilophila wadsworthia TaxID=35833 RepID=UPI002670F768|nr:Mu transposase C-terminal domain-containing protein [Bilophila wadsworthia]
MAMKDAYSTQELAILLCLVVSSIIRKARDENWGWRKRPGRGGGKEWLVSSMPEATQASITAAEAKMLGASEALPEICPSTPALMKDITPAILDDKRRYDALVKADLVALYLDWQRKYGHTAYQKDMFIAAYQGGAWPRLLAEYGPSLAWKSLERWKLNQKKAGSSLALADKRGVAQRGSSILTGEHHKIILGNVLNPNAPRISECMEKIQQRCKAQGLTVPSDATIRRFVKKFDAQCHDRFVFWRQGKKAWNDECVISIMRDWNIVDVGDIVIADGKVLNFETVNPDTGKPCRMTLVLFYDGRSRCPLGWEIMPTENTACISSAFRRTCIMLGKIPRVVYLDNGRAFRAEFFKGSPEFEQAGFCGLYRDLGCEVIHAWSYHGQTKPIERFFGTMHEAEVSVPSYVGRDIAHKPARLKRNETLHRDMYEALGGRPLTLEETHMVVARFFETYSNRPQHRTHLQGRTPAEVLEEGRGPGVDLQKLTLLMMEKEIRTITKDGIPLYGRLYYDEALYSRRHPVLVRYDLLVSPHTILVYTLEGDYICQARDREHYHIAYGVHPAASILGNAEHVRELEDAIAMKGGQESATFSGFRGMLELVKAEMGEREDSKKLKERMSLKKPAPKPKAVTAAEKSEIEDAKARAKQEMASPQGYEPSFTRRFRDEKERYEYLFVLRYERKIELVPQDTAWMEAFEQTPTFIRNFKAQYDARLEIIAIREERAAI